MRIEALAVAAALVNALIAFVMIRDATHGTASLSLVFASATLLCINAACLWLALHK